ncbi:MAG: chromosomal replication initiator protein DnaA [Bdellovibrionaceae bacterium]|nr:chromosomal replication initiator protein DnaA [Pseudobdellovibrionaceae bacterium]
MIITSEIWSQIKSKMMNGEPNNKLLVTWLDPISFIKSEDLGYSLRVTLGVPTALHQYWLNENIRKQITAELSGAVGSSAEVNFVVVGYKPDQGSQASNALQQALSSTHSSQPNLNIQDAHRDTQGNKRSGYSDSIKPEWTFQTFVVGKNNEFAHAACYNVSANPGAEDYNPLLIYGPSGMGKSHLLHACANFIRENSSHLKVLYVSSERFIIECIAAIRHKRMDEFRKKYRESYDVIIVDDIQFLARGEATQEEFFHFINSFIDDRKQVVLASDRMPKDILGLQDRNRTRLERGVMADITMPDLETRISILKYKAEQMGVSLSDDVITYISKISKRSIRELEGNLKKVKMFTELSGLKIEINIVKKILSDYESKSTISVEDIQKMVADHFNIKISDLKSTNRARPIVVPRQITMYLIKKFLDKSYVEIGRLFGGKDHTTVMNAIERIQNLQASDQDIFKHIEELETRINNITGV